jgi:AcrR family transcriptional regulator
MRYTLCMDTDIAGGASPGLRERKRQRTRRAISDAALRLFAERGFEDVTLAEIAAAADVAPATVFTHFATKEEIFFSRRDEFDAGLEEYLQAARTTEELLAGLRDWAMRNIDSILAPDSLERARDYARIMYASPMLSKKKAVTARERQHIIEEAIIAWSDDDASLLEIQLFVALVSAVTTTMFEVVLTDLAEGRAEACVRGHAAWVCDNGFASLTRAYAGQSTLDRA